MNYTIKISEREDARLHELTGKHGGEAVAAVLKGVLRKVKASPRKNGRPARKVSYAGLPGSKTYDTVEDMLRDIGVPGYEKN